MQKRQTDVTEIITLPFAWDVKTVNIAYQPALDVPASVLAPGRLFKPHIDSGLLS